MFVRFMNLKKTPERTVYESMTVRYCGDIDGLWSMDKENLYEGSMMFLGIGPVF